MANFWPLLLKEIEILQAISGLDLQIITENGARPGLSRREVLWSCLNGMRISA
jgi:hypothetical protein